MNASTYGPFTKNGITILVYMTAFGHWVYQAERGELYSRDTVEATNRVEAWDLAYEAARRELWTPAEILEREG